MDPRFESRTWGALLARGLFAILFGVLAFARPGGTATGLIYLFGAFAFLDGIAAIAASMNVAELHGRWWPLFLAGLAGVAVGVITFMRPTATAVGLVYYVSAWALITGFLEVVAAVRLRKVVEGEWMLAVAGLLSVAFGVLLAMRPGAGLLSLVWLIGAYAMVFGVLEIGLALRLRGVEHRLITTT